MAAAAASSSLQLLQCSSPANAQLRSCRNGGVRNPSVRKLKLASSNIEFTGRQRCRLYIEAYSVSGPCPTKLESTHQKQNPRQLASAVRPNPVQRTKSIRFSGRTFSSHFDTGTLSESAESLVSNFDTGVLNESAKEKVGVLLLNLGGPETLQDVQPFLYNLFADPDIIRLPRLFRFLQQPLAQLISTLRAPRAKEGYAAIGGGSPLRQITDEQAKALKEALELKRTSALVYVAMRYWHPFTEEALDQIKRDKISKLVVLPLYPHFSISTTGSSLAVLHTIFRQDEYFRKLPYFVIKSWYQREGYIRAMSNLIEKELQKFPSSNEVMVFFSAHGVPCSYVEKYNDPYKSQMEECVGLIMKELKARGIGNEHILAYQSRVGPVEWLKPYTDETIVQLGQKGVKSLLVIPISFVSEHIETLEEIDGEYKHLALNSGIKHWGRVPALGCERSFIADLAEAIIEALPFAAAVTPSRLVEGQTDSQLKYTIGSILSLGLVLGSKFVRLILRFLGLQPFTS